MGDIDLDVLKEELLQCRRCGLCRNAVYEAKGFDGVCPVWKNTNGFETGFMRGKIMVALALLDGILEKTQENAEALYTCTLCGNCTQICPAAFKPSRAIEQVRDVLNEIPNEVRDSIAEKIDAHDNPYLDGKSRKRDWTEALSFSVPTIADTLYFAGCTAGMKLPEVATDSARVLNAAGVVFAVMEEEPCCGSVMLRTGKRENARANAQRVVDAIVKTGAKRVVVSCAGCLRTLKDDYAQFGLKLPEVVHIVEFAADLIKDGRLKPKRVQTPMKVTYHDPCHLGREMGVYDSPREVLKSIPDIELVEMETNRATAMCCGAGGGLKSYSPEAAKRIAADRIRSAEKIGASYIVTSCPFCELNLEAGSSAIASRVDVVDVVNLLAQSLQ